MRFGVIVHAPQVVAARHRREGAVQRKNLEAVPRQIELADDFRPQQRDDVRADGEAEAGKHFFRHGRAADDVAPLEDEHLPSRAREIRGGRQAVMASANDDGVVDHCANRIRTRLQAAAARLVAEHADVQKEVDRVGAPGHGRGGICHRPALVSRIGRAERRQRKRSA